MRHPTHTPHLQGVDYARDTYGDTIETVKEELRKTLEDHPDQLAEAEAEYQWALDQAKCFRDLYEGSAQTKEVCMNRRGPMLGGEEEA